MVVVAAYSGFRPGELRGLASPNMDLERGVIHVRQQVRVVKGRSELTTELKTEHAYRSLKVPGFVVEEGHHHLKDWDAATTT